MEERMGDVSPSLKHRLKHSLCSCFKQNPLQHHPLHHHDHFDHSSPSSPHHHDHRLARSSSGGGSAGPLMRTSRSDNEFNIKDKCRDLISRISTPRGHSNHRKSRSTDFRYDPHSYSLNFDDGYDDDPNGFEEMPIRNFSSRLRASGTPSPSPLAPRPVSPQLPSAKSDAAVLLSPKPHQASTSSSYMEITACS